MEALKIKAYKTFVRQHDEIAEWYATQLGQKAMQKYLDDLESTIHRLTLFPQMGIIDERRSTSKRKYYSFLLHPHYRIIYRFTKKTLYLVAFQATRMKQ